VSRVIILRRDEEQSADLAPFPTHAPWAQSMHPRFTHNDVEFEPSDIIVATLADVKSAIKILHLVRPDEYTPLPMTEAALADQARMRKESAAKALVTMGGPGSTKLKERAAKGIATMAGPGSTQLKERATKGIATMGGPGSTQPKERAAKVVQKRGKGHPNPNPHDPNPNPVS
jgi:hypothetical protein